MMKVPIGEVQRLMKSFTRVGLACGLAFSLCAHAQEQQDPTLTPAPVVESSAFRSAVRGIVSDQAKLWASPFKMKKSEAKWWIGFAAGTAALVAFDQNINKSLPNTIDQMKYSGRVSQLGAPSTLYPVAGAFLLAGALTGNDKARRTGIEAAEALTDTFVLASTLKLIAGRERPLAGDRDGSFFRTGNNSFPSGHSMMTWSLASVVAHEYSNKKWVPFVAYTAATAVSLSRMGAQKHYAADVLAGGAMGWFIGRWIVNRNQNHNPLRADKSWLRPNVSPQISPGSGTYGVALTWTR